MDNEHKYLDTYWDDTYIKNCPVRYLSDCFSVGYNFYFIKETIIQPKFSYYLKNERKTFELSKNLTRINDFQQIEFGPIKFDVVILLVGSYSSVHIIFI